MTNRAYLRSLQAKGVGRPARQILLFMTLIGTFYSIGQQTFDVHDVHHLPKVTLMMPMFGLPNWHKISNLIGNFISSLSNRYCHTQPV